MKIQVLNHGNRPVGFLMCPECDEDSELLSLLDGAKVEANHRQQEHPHYPRSLQILPGIHWPPLQVMESFTIPNFAKTRDAEPAEPLTSSSAGGEQPIPEPPAAS